MLPVFRAFPALPWPLRDPARNAVLWQDAVRACGRALHTSIAPLTAGILSGLTGVLVHCFFENIFEEPYMMALFWGLTAALIAAPRLLRTGKDTEEST